MSRLSIYENRWIDLVFENKNKEYGAYQLRNESSRTTMMAFFSGLLLITLIGVIFTLTNVLKKPIEVSVVPILDEVIKVTPYTIVPDEPKIPSSTNQSTAPEETEVFVPLVVSTTQEAFTEVPKNTDFTENTSVNSSAGTGTGNATGTGNGNGTVENSAPLIDENIPVIASTLDKLPEFPGGINKFYTYVGNNFEKPEIEGMSSIKVYVSFVIEKDGTMTDIQVNRDPGYGLGKEAIRVLKSLKTKWSPGMIGSKPVRTSYNLPISVQIN